MTPEPAPARAADLGRQRYAKGYAFEDRVAESYRLLGYRVEHGRLFDGRQVDLFIELTLGDLDLRRAVECKAGEVTVDDLDRFLIKLNLVRRIYPDASGTLVAGLGFTEAVTSHAAAVGLQLTLYRDLSARIFDGPTYARIILGEIEQNDRYLPGVFVEPSIAYESTGESQNAFELIEQWLSDGHWNQLTLLGDVGTGKSFLCRMLAMRLAKAYLDDPKSRPLPILIDLRNADREFSLEGLILTHFASHGLQRATFDVFDFLVSEGRIVLLLDGFDEMASKVTPVITTRNFHELARAVKRNAKVLLTCRTHYFKSRTEEEEVILGGATKYTSDIARDLYWDLISRKGFKIAYLRPFSISQIETYIMKVCPAEPETIIKKIRSIYNLSELSQRPLLLEMIVKSVNKLTAMEINPAQLYEVFTDAWIHRDLWRDVLPAKDKLTFLMALARSLWEQESRTVHYQQLEEYINVELAELIDTPQRLVEIDGEIRTASFLTRDERGQYGFAHTSYAEYFLARYLSSHMVSGDLSSLAIRRLSHEVIDFLLLLIDKAGVEQQLTECLTKAFVPLISENALGILYRLRRNLLIAEKGRASDTAEIHIELPDGMRLQNAKLAQIDLEGGVLRKSHFDGADLREGIFAGADLSGSNLTSVSAKKADFRGASLVDVNGANAVLAEASFEGADVNGCDFRGADLSNAILTARNLQVLDSMMQLYSGRRSLQMPVGCSNPKSFRICLGGFSGSSGDMVSGRIQTI